MHITFFLSYGTVLQFQAESIGVLTINVADSNSLNFLPGTMDKEELVAHSQRLVLSRATRSLGRPPDGMRISSIFLFI